MQEFSLHEHRILNHAYRIHLCGARLSAHVPRGTRQGVELVLNAGACNTCRCHKGAGWVVLCN